MNTNCLKGIRCPDCGNEDEFAVSCTTWATVIDNGIRDAVDMEWGNDSAAECGKCGKRGLWADFVMAPHDAS